MSEWKDVLLSDVAKIQQGFAFKSQDFNDTGGIPIIKIKNISSGEVDLSQTQYYTKDTASLSKYFVSKGDILIAMTGSHLDQPSSVVGRVSIMRNNTKCLLNQRTAKIIPQSFDDKIDGMFLYYNLIQEETISVLAGNASGSANQANISSEQIYRLNILLPPLPEQQTIAEVLTSLDDKIDLLQRNNKTLEQMAETLFRQWFVVEAKEEWEVSTLKDEFKIAIGRTPPRVQTEWFSYNELDYKWASIKDMDISGIYLINTAEKLTAAAVERFKIPIIPENTLLLSFKMTIGRLAITNEPMLSNEAIAHFIEIPSSNLYTEFLYLYLKTYKWEQLGSTSSIVEAINSQMIKDMDVVVPEMDLLNRFKKIIVPYFDKIKANQLMIQSLSRMRDTLLPKLMSGQVRVELK